MGVYLSNLTYLMVPDRAAHYLQLFLYLLLEPFLQRIRQNANIKCLIIDQLREQKVAAYADDLLLYIAGPRLSILNKMVGFKEFGRISKFQINAQKS